MIMYKVTITFKDYKVLELLVKYTELDAKTNRLICHLVSDKHIGYYIMLDTVRTYRIEEIR